LAGIHPEGINALIEIVRDTGRTYYPRYRAINILAKNKEKLAVDALIATANENIETLPGVAAAALGEIGDVRAVEALIAIATKAAQGGTKSIPSQTSEMKPSDHMVKGSYNLAWHANKGLVGILGKSSSQLSVDQLRLVARLTPVVLVWQMPSGCAPHSEKEDFAQARQLARQELSRRGIGE
jgi:hypothetical protein